MELEWLGKSRPLIEDLFYWSNTYAASCKKKVALTEKIALSASEIQVIEYLLENEELQLNMAGVARRLGISPVSFTNLVSRLEKLGLVQKYYREGDRKSMIVLVTALGREIYGISIPASCASCGKKTCCRRWTRSPSPIRKSFARCCAASTSPTAFLQRRRRPSIRSRTAAEAAPAPCGPQGGNLDAVVFVL